jgi:hypothetical protein
MQPGEIKQELERLAAEAAESRDRLAALGAKISAACELVTTVRSGAGGSKPDERTPAGEPAQEPEPGSGEAKAG